MAPNLTNVKTLNREVAICRFGSAYSTLTVMLLDGSTHTKIQDTMKSLDDQQQLTAPKPFVGERVCFRNSHGIWKRARISVINETESAESTRVDVVLEDTQETLRRVDFRALAAIPGPLKTLPNARVYFIDGLEPYKWTIGPETIPGTVGAQLSANALNAHWTSPPSSTMLVRTASFSDTNVACRARIDVATVRITQSLSLLTYILDILCDHVSSCISKPLSYGARHPWHPVILCPQVSPEEVCEVIALRKTSPDVLEVGLRLGGYLESTILKDLLKKSNRPQSRPIQPKSPVCIVPTGHNKQRGVILEDGTILGIDTLETFAEGSVEIRTLPFSISEVLPHTGLFIVWDTTTGSQTPCVGDTVIVKGLKEDLSTPLRFSYSEVSIVENSAPISYHPSLSPHEVEPVTRPKPAKKTARRNSSRFPTMVEWYGLHGELSQVLENVLPPSFDPTYGALFAQHSFAVPLCEL